MMLNCNRLKRRLNTVVSKSPQTLPKIYQASPLIKFSMRLGLLSPGLQASGRKGSTATIALPWFSRAVFAGGSLRQHSAL